MAADYQKLVE